MSGRRTRSGGAAQRSGPRAPSPTKPLRRSQRKSGSELPSILPEIWPKTPSAAAIRKPIVLKRIVAHAVEVPAVQSPRRSPRSLRSRQKAHSKLANERVAQPVEEQEPKDTQASEERNSEPPSSEQLEPTVTFLFTLLNTSEPTEPKDPESDSEVQEYRFLDQEDWGPQRTSKEIRRLQNDCMRLRESLNTTQVHNLALGEKLQNLPTLLYKSLREGAQAIQEEAQAIQDEVKALQEETQALLEVALLSDPNPRKAGLLFMLPDLPHSHRDQGQAWLGPRSEVGHLLGRPLHQPASP
ncbi:sororin isoform X3 [Papio anubis]|uniref:sororin isoform X3 n=1 Tax=Papio anubis TaxID=9555 RepID=UPI0012AE4487|nr:sororin isoform X3 [Papio anubis]